MKNKKMLIIGLVLFLLVGGSIFAVIKIRQNRSGEEPTEERQRTRITEPVNIIDVAERPYMLIEPVADGHHVVIRVESLNKPADELEFELEYQSGTLIQGALGSIEIDQLPASKKIMLGSCSAGGACSFHEDIKGGSLLMRFTSEEKYILKTDWRYLENVARETAISSRDVKFQLEAKVLANHRYLVVTNSPGAPEDLEAQLKSEIYTLASTSALTGEGILTIRAGEESEKLAIYGYNGTEWTKFESTVDGKEVTATVELMQTYVVGEEN